MGSDLRNMCRFYQAFQNWNAVRTELSWAHYNLLARIEKLTGNKL